MIGRSELKSLSGLLRANIPRPCSMAASSDYSILSACLSSASSSRSSAPEPSFGTCTELRPDIFSSWTDETTL
uniref:Uncharacterized protein n=1 Tax=Timema genevievae TaxID=629358 RepID=A0A7R9PN57_TIMGE|nr:unnamed protein product [Timema genevievae]